MSIADALERESAERYRDLAENLRKQEDTLVAAEFASLGDIEDQSAQVAARGIPAGVQANESAFADWRSESVLQDDEAHNAQVSSYRALAFAVRNEERALPSTICRR